MGPGGGALFSSPFVDWSALPLVLPSKLLIFVTEIILMSCNKDFLHIAFTSCKQVSSSILGYSHVQHNATSHTIPTFHTNIFSCAQRL